MDIPFIRPPKPVFEKVSLELRGERTQLIGRGMRDRLENRFGAVIKQRSDLGRSIRCARKVPKARRRGSRLHLAEARDEFQLKFWSAD